MNICYFSGNLTKDAVIGTAKTGKKYARLSFAVKRLGNGTDDFFRAVAWDKTAEYIENGMKEGRFLCGCEVEVRGKMHNVAPEAIQNANQNGNQNNAGSQNGGQNGNRTTRYDELTIEETFSKKKNGFQPEQGGYQAAQQPGVYQAAPQQGSYGAAPQPQGGYQSAPQSQGGYQAAPQPQGGYQTAPQPQQGVYRTAPQPQGGYQTAPQPQQGVQTGSFQQIPAPQPQQSQGGFKAAQVNVPMGQGAYAGGYPEGTGYGN